MVEPLIACICMDRFIFGIGCILCDVSSLWHGREEDIFFAQRYFYAALKDELLLDRVLLQQVLKLGATLSHDIEQVTGNGSAVA